MAGAGAPEVRFEDVMVHFSTEEFGMLEKWQQELYFEVLMENYESLIIIGNPVTMSDVMVWLKRGEGQNCTESRGSRAGGDSSTTGGGLGQMECYTETLEPPKMVEDGLEEETAQYGNPGGTSERSCVPFMQQGRTLGEECIPHLEKATAGSAGPTHSQDAAVAPKPYECQECGARFRLKGLLHIHQMVSSRKPSLPCPECGACVSSSWHLKRHQRIHRQACADGGGACRLDRCQGSQAEGGWHFFADCGESFRWYLDFLQHQKSHEEAKVWPCVQCDDMFMHPSDLVMHEERHFSGACSEALGVCSPCGEDCVCRRSFLCHFASQKSTESSRTDSREDVKPHWEGRSELEKPYSCHQCGEQFRLEVNLGVHYRYCPKKQQQKSGTSPGHRKEGGKRVRSGSAPKASRNSSSHPPPKPSARWPCCHCRKSFTSRYCLYKHRQRHKAEAGQSAAELNKSVSPASGVGGRALVGVTKTLYTCQECGKRFVFKQQLVTHMKVHAGESCCRDTCGGESLGSQGAFGEHRRILPGERPPSSRRREISGVPPVAAEPKRQEEKELQRCAECGKSLKVSYFPAHRAWHAGVRYMCLLCGKVYSFQSACSHHLQQHWKREGLSSCPRCGNRTQSKSCVCLIGKINRGQKPLPSLCSWEERSPPVKDSGGKHPHPASYEGHIPSGTEPGQRGGE